MHELFGVNCTKYTCAYQLVSTYFQKDYYTQEFHLHKHSN